MKLPVASCRLPVGTRRLLAVVAALGTLACSQQPSNLVKPRIAGRALASQFGKWKVMADGPITGSGQPETVTLRSSAFTLPDGTAWQPLRVGAPVAIGDDAQPEIVVPISVDCGVGGPGCSFTADFAHPHAGHFSVASATAGLQEAINYEASHGGGTVILDPDWAGNLADVLPVVKLPSSVLLLDERAGDWTAYGLGNGGQPQEIASFSSASGASIEAQSSVQPGSLNGVRFSHAFKFPAVAPGVPLSAGVATTITPAWSVPQGVQAGDTLNLDGGMGAAEVVTLTQVGTACPGGTTASVCFTPANNHTGDWTLSSATSGLQEAVNAAGPGGWVLDDEPVAELEAPLVLAQTVRLTGYSTFDASVGTRMEQMTPNTDTIQVGTPTTTANDVVIEHLTAQGAAGDGTDSGVAIHCLNCVHLKLMDVVGKQAHDGVFFDSTYGHAYVGDIENSHFIDNYYGVHIVGGSANRLTFVADTVDANVYGVFDDGGWVHTWMGDDFESNTKYGYWQQVSQPAHYSGRNVDLISNYFEGNGSNTAGQGDVFLGQLVNGGTGNNGAGCSQCVLTGNIFNASLGGNVMALNFGAVSVTLDGNDYSGYATGKRYATITGPNPNFSYVLSLGDGDVAPLNSSSPEGFGGAAAGDITRVDGNSALVLGGTDRLTDQFGTMLNDTTIESPTGVVLLRGKPGGAASVNAAELYLDGNSTSVKSNEIKFRNQNVDEWGIKNDPAGANSHDFCLVEDYANPAAATCDLYINQQKRFRFAGSDIPGNVTLYGDYNFLQQANGDPALVINRATDTAPTGFLLDIEDQTNSHPLFRVDASGNVSGNGGLNIAGAATFQSTVAMGAGSTVGGQPISTAPAVVRGASGTFWSGTYTAGQCTPGGISFSSSVAVGMVAVATPETAPPAGLVWNAYIDAANHVTVNVCNISANPVTWSAGTVFQIAVIP